MTFKRIDESTIRCIVTEEDMEENGLELDDFFTQSDKAQNFLREMVEQATEEVGYEAAQGMVSLQIMPLPNHALAITFSEIETDELQAVMENLRALLQDVKDRVLKKGMLQDGDALHRSEAAASAARALPISGETPALPVSDGSGNTGEAAQTDDAQIRNISEKGLAGRREIARVELRVFGFMSLRNVIQYAHTVQEKNPVVSTLYKDTVNNVFYMTLEKGRLSAKKYNNLCTNATEFSTYVQNGSQILDYLQEHGEVLIERRAVKVLAKL